MTEIKNFVQYVNSLEKFKRLSEIERNTPLKDIEYFDTFKEICESMPKSEIYSWYLENSPDIFEYTRYVSFSSFIDSLAYSIDCGDYEIEGNVDMFLAAIDDYLDWALNQEVVVFWPLA